MASLILMEETVLLYHSSCIGTLYLLTQFFERLK